MNDMSNTTAMERSQYAVDEIRRWRTASGLDYEVLEAPVHFPVVNDVFGSQQAIQQADRYKVLYHSLNLKPISVIGKGYKVVQPRHILNFFHDIIELFGYEFARVGVTHDYRRVWAMARIGEGAEVVAGDVVLPYIILITSYDGSLATVGMPLQRRLYCMNQLPGLLRTRNGDSSIVRFTHMKAFNADDIKQRMTVIHGAYQRLLNETRRLARIRVPDAHAQKFVMKLLKLARPTGNEQIANAAFKTILEKYNGGGIAASNEGVAGTAWGLLNAVTEYVDHNRGREKTRSDSALIGAGSALKTRALDLLTSGAY